MHMKIPPHILKHRAIGAKKVKAAALDALLEWRSKIELSKRNRYHLL